MTEKKEEQILEAYIGSKNLKHSRRRSEILDVFLSVDRHLTADELYRIVRKKYPEIGFATVYRTLKLLCECGLSREMRFQDSKTRYEHLYAHKHHDHLICTKCGRFIEIIEPEMESLQEKLFTRYGFLAQRHRMELYGLCGRCKR